MSINTNVVLDFFPLSRSSPVLETSCYLASSLVTIKGQWDDSTNGDNLEMAEDTVWRSVLY